MKIFLYIKSKTKKSQCVFKDVFVFWKKKKEKRKKKP